MRGARWCPEGRGKHTDFAADPEIRGSVRRCFHPGCLLRRPVAALLDRDADHR